jgi:tripeptide aminopeptidase
MAASSVEARASAQEKADLVEQFIRLCELESPSGSERQIADVVADELRGLGLAVAEDASASDTGSSAGNLLARIDGAPGAPTILLCAHLDTVPLAAPVDVVREDDVLSNRNDAIVGADNKAAVAVILAVARRLARGGSPVGVEILFTTCEERALAGAKAFDIATLGSDFGFVFDHASPIGELITAAPTYYHVEGRFRGHAVHAGLCPELGHNAIAAAAAAVSSLEFGRLDAETTRNVGLIAGGSAPNVVAEHCTVTCEARAIDTQRAAAVASEIVDAMTEAATDGGCDVELTVEERFRGYHVPRTAAPVQVATRALADVGIEAEPISTGGGSDANVFQARGFQCLNVANGTEGAHQPDERVAVAALETMLDVALGLVRHAASP